MYDIYKNDNIMNVHFRSDFKLVETPLNGEFSAAPFKFTYKTIGAKEYVASYDGTLFSNCKLLPKGELMVAFDAHGLPAGNMTVKREYFLTDKDYHDGICNYVTTDTIDVCLVSGKTDIIEVHTSVYPNYQKGDPFTYDDFTPQQLEDIKRPAVEAKAECEALSKSITDAEALRVQSEQNRQSEFATLKTGMQTATQEAKDKLNNISNTHGAIILSEKARSNNEAKREESEAARVLEETKRKDAENLRVTEEAKRIAEENARKQIEQARVSEEGKRAADENARKQTEQDRVNNENTRKQSEQTRVNNENTRVANENARRQSEQARVQSEQNRQTEFARLKTASETATQNATTAATQANNFKSYVTEYNVSKLHSTSGIGGTNKFTLAEAIKLIPADLRSVGIKCSFVDESDNLKCYIWNGNSFSNTISWDIFCDNGMDSKPSDTPADLNIADEEGNVLAEFKEGHFKTKMFDTRDYFDNLKTDLSNAELNIVDEKGNAIMELRGGHLKTKMFDSRNTSQQTGGKNLKVLFIGNSVNQDHIAYLPWLLKQTYGDSINFTICNFYIGSFTINSYVNEVITGQRGADIWSVAENTEQWTNTTGTSLEAAIKYTDYDIISVQGYFNNSTTETGVKGPEDMSKFPQLIDYIKAHALKPFTLGFLMHQTYKSKEQGAFARIIEGAKIALKNSPVGILFPCGLATTYAMELGYPQAELTPDNIHNTEGLPCIMGSYVVATMLSNFYNLPNKIVGNVGRMTKAIQATLRIPGANGAVNEATTEEQYAICQKAAIQAVKAGYGLRQAVEIEMFNLLNQ